MRIPPPSRAGLAAVLGALTERDVPYWLERFTSPCLVYPMRSLVQHRWRGAPDVDHRVRWTVDGPAEAWERLAIRGLIPGDWVEDPHRRFHCQGAHADDGKCSAEGGCAGRGWVATPNRFAVIVTLAADVSGVLAAEAFAREFSKRRTVCWRVMPRAEWRNAGLRFCDIDKSPDPEPDAGSPSLDDVLALGYRIHDLRGDATDPIVELAAPEVSDVDLRERA